MEKFRGKRLRSEVYGVFFAFIILIIASLALIDCNGGGSSDSDSDSTPSAPGSLQAQALSASQISLSWTDNSQNEDGFRIERRSSGGSYSEITTVAANTTSYPDTGLSAGVTYYYRVRAYNASGNSAYSNEASATTLPQGQDGAIIIDHTCTTLNTIPQQWITSAKSDLHIAYGHTSHGSQLVTGMTGLASWKGNLYAFNSGGTGGALDLRDTPFSGASDLGNPDRTAWATATRSYLNAHPEINVVIWSWCGQVSDATAADITTYLSLMSGLEGDYPDVKFVYMTGHLDGTGLSGNLHQRNEQIRTFCRDNDKILYDFADIETYNPDGVYFGDKHPTDGCNYDYNNSGSTTQTGDPATPTNGDRNWAIDWQNSHVEGIDWYDCSPAHTQPLNGNLKAYAAWWLWARLAGWEGQ